MDPATLMCDARAEDGEEGGQEGQDSDAEGKEVQIDGHLQMHGTN